MITTLLVIGLMLLVIVIAGYYLFPGAYLDAALGFARRRGSLSLDSVEIDGHTIPYLHGGRGEALVLLHGFGANKDHWTMIAPELTRHFHVYAPDLPGFGDASRLPDASYGLPAQLERLEQFVTQLGLTDFHLGGNSMGGYFAAMYAAAHPGAVKTLWLLAPAGVFDAEPSEALKMIEAGDNPLVAKTLEQFDRLSELRFNVVPPMPAQFKRPLLERSRREAPFNEKIFEQLFSEPVPLAERIAGLETPSLVVWGDNDRILHCQGLEIVCGLLPNATAVLMPAMGHAPMLERPAETAADYLSFQQRS